MGDIKTILFDGDGLVYRCGFAAEKRQYNVVDASGKIFFSAPYKKEVDAFLETTQVTEYTVEKETLVEPLEYALNNVNTVIESVKNKFDGIPMLIFIGKNVSTFRHELATIRPYKGNRDDAAKPVHYDAIRDFLVREHNARETEGLLETDDVLGLLQTPNTIILSNDKDLYQIPGWHFDWTKDSWDGTEPVYIPEHEAVRYKWIQVLSGDATDNIEGLPGVGEKTAIKMLSNTDDADLEETVRDIYEDFFDNTTPIKGKGYSPADYAAQLGMTWKEILDETIALITIKRKKDVVF